MPITESKISHFLAWWKQGLIQPLLSLLPGAKAAPIVLSVDDGVVYGPLGEKLSNTQLEQYRKAEGVYLLAPRDKVISKRISESQQGLPLALIAAKVLPFEVGELVLARDELGANIHAIVRSDLAAPRSVIEAHELRIIGAAFNSGENVLLAKQPLTSDEADHEVMVLRRSTSVILCISAFLIVSLPAAGFAYLSHAESLRARQFSDELIQLNAQLSANQVHSIDSLSAQIEMRDAAAVLSSLRSFSKVLTAAAEVDQLILSTTQLLVDASAESATQIQANLDASEAFETSEFVSSISRSATRDNERFRLKVNLKEER